VNIHLKIDGAKCIVHYISLALQYFHKLLYKKFISVADFGGERLLLMKSEAYTVMLAVGVGSLLK
jgi:hypothetical protein